jgi:hypothetical protein
MITKRTLQRWWDEGYRTGRFDTEQRSKPKPTPNYDEHEDPLHALCRRAVQQAGMAEGRTNLASEQALARVRRETAGGGG